MIASITMSQSARSCRLVVGFNRARDSSFCLAVIPPFSGGRSANFASDFLNSSKTFIEIFLIDFEHRDVESSHRCHLRNTRAHQPTAQNAHFFNFHSDPSL